MIDSVKKEGKVVLRGYLDEPKCSFRRGSYC